MTEKKQIPVWIKWLIILCVIAVIVFIAWWFLRPKQTDVQSEDQTDKTVSLQCEVSDIDGAFFESSTAQKITHEIRATFKNDKIDKMSYTFYGVYNSHSVAENVNAILHGQYNKYMGEQGLSQQSLNPDFATIGDDLKITLFTDRAKLSSLTTQFFFLDTDEYQRLASRSVSEMKELYEAKGFSCEVNE